MARVFCILRSLGNHSTVVDPGEERMLVQSEP